MEKSEQSQQSEKKVVYKVYQCHLCPQEFAKAGNYRAHLIKHNSKFFFNVKSGSKKAFRGVEFIEKKDLENHEKYQTWFKCPGCENHYAVMDNLATHLNNSHLNKASSSITTPLEVHVREPSDMPSPKIVKKRRTSNEVHQSIFNYSSKAESVIGNNMLKAFGCSSSTMKIKDSKRISEVTIVSSKKDFNILSSYNAEPVKIEMEPALGEEEQTEKQQYLSENYLNHFLQGTRFAWLLEKNGYDEINQQCLSILNFDWTITFGCNTCGGSTSSFTKRC